MKNKKHYSLFTIHYSDKPRGFTLIELLVVIAVIAILSAVILGSLGSARQQSRDARRLADLRQIQTALELYLNDNRNLYPTALSGLVSGGYMVTIPTDPRDGSAYLYAALGSGANCRSYHLGATLENASHSALDNDADAVAGTACTGSAADFSGTGAIYDLKP